MLYESYGIGGWLQWGALLAAGDRVAAALRQRVDVRAGAADLSGTAGPARSAEPDRSLTMMLGVVLVVTTLIGTETALGFVFDPRYHDFPFAALTMAVVPFSTLMLLNRPQAGVRPIAEAVFAGLLAASALYTGFNEGTDNWQSLWTCAIYSPARRYAVAGAGRANPKISRPIARPDRPTL